MAFRLASMSILGPRADQPRGEARSAMSGASTSFRARLSRNTQSEAWGISVVVHPKISGLSILEVEGTECVQEWNQKHPHELLKCCCSIMEVNGCCDIKSMAQELRQSNHLDLLINTELTFEQRWALKKSKEKQERVNAIDKILQVHVHEGPAECCAICHDDMETDSKVVRLPCKHHFHGHCARQWLVQKARCPLCNLELDLQDAP